MIGGKIMKKKFKQLAASVLAVALTVSSLTAPGTAVSSQAVTTKYPARVSVHDPSIAVSKEGTYYVFGSHIEAAKSTDLIDWSTFTNGYARTNNQLFGNLSDNLKESFKWAGENDVDSAGGFSVWAPDVFWNENYVNADGSKGAYLMYYCTTSTAVRSVIGFATSQNIEGPYVFAKNIVYSGFTKETAYDSNSKIDKKYTNTNIDELIADGTLKDGLNDSWFNGNTAYNNSYAPNALDPTVFEDKDGKLWMTYGSWSGGIFVLEIDPATGEAKYPGKNSTTADGLVVDEYFGTHIAGGYAKSGEGPYVVYDKESDYYYLYVSYEGLASTGGYNMRLFRSKSPNGPYTDAAGNNAVISSAGTNHSNIGIKVMGNYTLPSKNLDMTYMSPGHNSALIDEKDGQRYLIYHTRFSTTSAVHQVRVHQQYLNSKGWPVTAPYEYKGDQISSTGYDTSSIIGDYYFINHGTNSDGSTVRETQTITLNSNGKITGDVTGSWSAQNGTYYMSVTISGVTYDGVFYLQQDESSSANRVMTFSAIGTNNQTVWGVQKKMSLSASKSTIYAGGNKNNTSQLTVNGLAGRTATVTYKSSKSSVASVNSKGKVTAKKKGTATITATVKYSGTTKTFTKKITVKKASLKLSKKKASLKAGKTFTYKVTAKGIKSSSVRWTSSNKKVMTINKKTGKAKAVKAGKTTITAAYKNIKVKVKVKVK
jgi:arabinan endo-1,5-alpha-L-arabinosidase